MSTNRWRQAYRRKRTVAEMFWVTLGLFIFMAVFGLVGKMDYEDQVKVEEFRKEYMVISDDKGEPQLVAREVRDAKPMRQVQAARTLF